MDYHNTGLQSSDRITIAEWHRIAKAVDSSIAEGYPFLSAIREAAETFNTTMARVFSAWLCYR